jgi:hypothetical protein
MQATEALRIARISVALYFDIEPDFVAGRYTDTYVPIGANSVDVRAAAAYNKLSDILKVLGE